MRKGFTLVELSIVLVIIGLLIGGLLVGQNLINNAKIKRFMSEINQFAIQTNLFKQKFKFYPGDLTANIAADCTHYCTLGNSDGILNSSAEQNNYWYHLWKAGYIPFHGVGVIYQDSSQSVGFGSWDNNLQRGNAYYSALDDTYYGAGAYASSPVIIAASSISNTNGIGIFTVEDAKSLDDKYDDGIPNSGQLWGIRIGPGYCTWSGTAVGGAADSYRLGQYTDGVKRCRFFFDLLKL